MFFIAFWSALLKFSWAPSFTPGIRSMRYNSFKESLHCFTKSERGRASPVEVMVKLMVGCFPDTKLILDEKDLLFFAVLPQVTLCSTSLEPCH